MSDREPASDREPRSLPGHIEFVKIRASPSVPSGNGLKKDGTGLAAGGLE